jgi:hypothetical protein
MPKRPVAPRLRQQLKLVVDFGVSALHIPSVDALLEEACRVAAEGLSVKLAKALRFDPVSEALVFAASVGWREADRQSVRFAVNEASPPGYAYLSGRPAVSSQQSPWGRESLSHACNFRQVADFPSPHGTGLEMRLIRSYSGFGRGAVEVDRSVPFSRITVRFRPS